MTVQINQAASTMYGQGIVTKINAASVIVSVNGADRKFSHKQFAIMNNGAQFVAGKAA